MVDGLDFPLDAVTQKFAWLGRSGSGKTYGCKRFFEQLMRAGAQVVIVDTVGVYFGLRRGAKGFEIPIVGGLYGDIPLEASSGELLAEVVVSHGSSMVVDVSHMRDADKARFMESFGRRLFELKKATPGAMHVGLDEGQDVVPQNPQPNEAMMLHEWVRIAKQGRAFGIGLSIASQRPQEVAKKALNQAECVIAFQLTGPQERKALEYWLADKGIDQKVSDQLPSLEIGKPFVWSPQWLKVAKVFGRILPIESDDTSQTPTLGGATPSRSQLKPIDLGKLRASMAAAEKDAVENDPKQLKQLVKTLEQKMEKLRGGGELGNRSKMLQVLGHAQAMRISRTREREAIQSALALFQNVMQELNAAMNGLVGISVKDEIADTIDAINKVAQSRTTGSDELDGVVDAAKNLTPKETLALSVKAGVHTPDGKLTERYQGSDENPLGIPKGELSVLRAVASQKDGARPALLTLQTQLRGASVRSYLARLASKGLVTRSGGVATITREGLAAAGTLPKRLKGVDLVKQQVKSLPSGEGSVLLEVLEAHPEKISSSTIVTKTGLSGASVRSYLARLVTRRLIARAGGEAWLRPEVFK